MIDFPVPLEFEWDKGNIHKSYKKHLIEPNEAEQIFVDKDVIVNNDKTHSQVETRLVAIGQTLNKQILFIIYTLRNKKIRIISARPADRKERRLYEKAKKNPQF